MFALAAAATVGMSFAPAIPQAAEYHQFADRRTLLGIPNALDVLSNVPFLSAGLAGVIACRRRVFAERNLYIVFFAAAGLVGVGSGYYHWAPDNERLVWDRLPMTAGFVSLLAAVIAERVDVAWGKRLLAPLLAVGIGSVFYWIGSERLGRGDLRPYGLVQFLSLALISYMLVAYRSKYTHPHMYWVGLGWYALAKVCEHFDGAIHEGTGRVVSGHSLKHVAAAVGFFWLAGMIARRRLVDAGEERHGGVLAAAGGVAGERIESKAGS